MKSSLGFTLIELMIVVAIIAIFAAIAIPSYSRYIVASHRTEAQAAMLTLAQFLESKYNASFSYPNPTDQGTSAAISNISSPVADYYSITVTVPSELQSYSITAKPTTKQRDPICGTLTLKENGAKTPTTSGCWK